MAKELKIALAGNPNSGKTTLFNILTGSNQYVGNWPGVTVEKKEGQMKDNKDIIVTDLPGIYSLSPYSPEEIVARNYLINERPDAILNIVDGTNLERNLYLTTQLAEIGIPIIIAINMMDIVRKNGDIIDTEKLSKALGIKIFEISALKGTGIDEAAAAAIEIAKNSSPSVSRHIFSGSVEHALAHIEEAVLHDLPDDRHRWYAIKIFERDNRVIEHLKISDNTVKHIENDIKSCEYELDDDSESIIANERYNYITDAVSSCYKRSKKGASNISDKIDKIATNRILALPLFVFIMWVVYTISIGTVGDWTVTFMNDGLFGSFSETYETGFLSKLYSIPELLNMIFLNADGIPVMPEWLYSLIMDGVIGGVGTVLGFVPQMLILFLLLSILEDCGYMSRIAFIMDKIFRKFGLSGKSFIPMLVASGCGVPGIMASRTIEQDRDRRMTIMTTGFIPCGAKMPIVGLIAGALFNNSSWVATGAYLVGIGAVIISGIILKKTKAFAGEPAPFVMELPTYHSPVAGNVLRATWERGWDFIKRAGTVVLGASIIIWVLNSLSFDGGFHYINGGDETSILNLLGGVIAHLFTPLGFGNWQAAVATILGLVAKEEVVGVFGSLTSMSNADMAFELVETGNSAGLVTIGQEIFSGSKLAGFSFMMFNLLCAPCFAAMGAIKREMNNGKWTAFAITYMCAFAYVTSLIVYQLGTFYTGGAFTVWTAIAFLLLAALVYMLLRPNKNTEKSSKGMSL
ncbi:MAG: ferrous iron transport protein B [Clostridia bacterium]|nr:ferrous iron transport protein B [Clostridia bacterium]